MLRAVELEAPGTIDARARVVYEVEDVGRVNKTEATPGAVNVGESPRLIERTHTRLVDSHPRKQRWIRQLLATKLSGVA